MSKYRAILCTGDRYATDRVWLTVVVKAIWRISSADDCIRIIHGDQGKIEKGKITGIDSMAKMVGRTQAFSSDLPMPYITALGRAGGPVRNKQMVAVMDALRMVGYQTTCLAFHDEIHKSSGTKGCLNLAVAGGHECFLCTSDYVMAPITTEVA